MVPAVITAVYMGEVEIQMSNAISAIITLTAIYGVVSVVEVVSFSPFLGSAGTEEGEPALAGALAAPYFIKNKKLSIPTVAAACLLYLVLGYSFMSAHYSYFMLGFIVVSFLCYLLLYKVGYVKENPKRKVRRSWQRDFRSRRSVVSSNL